MIHTENSMRWIATVVEDLINEESKPIENGFVLLVFPFGGPEGQRTNYVSNGRRQDVMVALKEIIARLEGQPEQSGRA